MTLTSAKWIALFQSVTERASKMPWPLYSRGKATRRWEEREVKCSLLLYANFSRFRFVNYHDTMFFIPDIYSHSASGDIFFLKIRENTEFMGDYNLSSNWIFISLIAKEQICAGFDNCAWAKVQLGPSKCPIHGFPLMQNLPALL